MTISQPSPSPRGLGQGPVTSGDGAARSMFREYLSCARLAEVVYRDSAGQICIVHDRIRDLFSRAGQDFILLGRGTLLPVDHILTVDGRLLADSPG